MREKKTIGKTNEKETYMDGKKKKIERIDSPKNSVTGKDTIATVNERERMRKKKKGR